MIVLPKCCIMPIVAIGIHRFSYSFHYYFIIKRPSTGLEGETRHLTHWTPSSIPMSLRTHNILEAPLATTSPLKSTDARNTDDRVAGFKVEQRRFLGEGTYTAYPHCNSFVSGSPKLIVGRLNAIPAGNRLLSVDLETFAVETLPQLPKSPDDYDLTDICFDVALKCPRIAALSSGSAWILDLSGNSDWRKVYTPPDAVKLQDLPSISPDGRRLLIGETRPDCYAAVEIDLDTQQARTLFTQTWYANHFHYCPHDPSWIGFSHEGPTATTLDRCWAWHAQLAPLGRCVFDQFSIPNGSSHPLNAGHERWSFHNTSAYVVAYAVSPGSPRGIYEIFADERPHRLLRESNTAWHCNMDATGRIAVIDTSAPWDPLPATGADYQAGVSAHLKADKERTPNISDVVLLDLVTGEDLLVARVTRTRHPWHPHPALSPNARWIIYNDADPATHGAWLVRLQSPLS